VDLAARFVIFFFGEDFLAALDFFLVAFFFVAMLWISFLG